MIIVFLSFIIGTSITILVSSLWAILLLETKTENKTYRDEPPRAFKLLWPVILMMERLARLLLSQKHETKILLRLQRGGIEYALTPVQFFSAKLTFSLFGLASLAACATLLLSSVVLPMFIGSILGFMFPDYWLRCHTKQRFLAILKALPFFLDIVTLAVEAGMSLSGSIQKAAIQTPPGPLSNEINQVMRDIRAGKARIDALRKLSERLQFNPITSLVSAMVQGELTGSSLGPVLRAQSDQRRSERFQHAEKLAMQAPVKMLAPLVLFIFPCTFLIIGFPIMVKFMTYGI